MKAVASGEIDDLLILGNERSTSCGAASISCGQGVLFRQSSKQRDKGTGTGNFPLQRSAREAARDSPPVRSEILRFATSGSDMSLIRSADPYIREIACLHGLSQSPRHEHLLRAVFDEDEELAMDAIEQVEQSASL